MMIPTVKPITKFVRRRPWFSATVFIFAFLTFVPVQPYTPTCGPSGSEDIKVAMSADYRTSLKAHFVGYDVYYWDIGGVILLRLLPFMDGNRLLSQGDGIATANHNAAYALASKRYIGSYVGEELNGRIYRVPEFIEALRDPKTGKFDITECDFLMPIVMGKPLNEASSPEQK